MKHFALVSLFFAAITLFGCTKNEVVIPNQTITTTIAPGDWQFDNNTQTYFAAINMPEIDESVNETDGVLVSIGSGNGVYEALPEVYNGYSYTFTHQPGNLTLEVQGADGATVAPPNYSIVVKIVLVKSRP